MKMSFSFCPSSLYIPPLSTYPLSPSFSSSVISLFQPFMSPRYPGGPRPSLRMPNQVLGTRILTFLTHTHVDFINSQKFLCCQECASILISFHVGSFLSLLGESLDLSLSCQTVWTRQDRKVRLGRMLQDAASL